MRDIPLEAKVECEDSPCGKSGIVILHPDTREVTHFVVQDTTLPGRDQRLVPIDQVVETSRNRIRLKYTTSELGAMDHFVDSHDAPTRHEPSIDYPVGLTVRSVPWATLSEPGYASETVERIPPASWPCAAEPRRQPAMDALVMSASWCWIRKAGT